MTAPSCPDPRHCPVPDPTPAVVNSLTTATLAAGTVMWRVYEVKYGYNTYNPGFGNPGFGNSRFAPIANQAGQQTPTIYLGSDEIVALIETVFHDVHHTSSDRVIYESMLRNRGLVSLALPESLTVIDLRNDQLERIGITRAQLVTTTAEHYGCTAAWAADLHTTRTDTAGIVWDSRQAELLDLAEPRQVCMLYGDRAPAPPGQFPLAGTGVINLLEGRGRSMIDLVANHLNATIATRDNEA